MLLECKMWKRDTLIAMLFKCVWSQRAGQAALSAPGLVAGCCCQMLARPWLCMCVVAAVGNSAPKSVAPLFAREPTDGGSRSAAGWDVRSSLGLLKNEILEPWGLIGSIHNLRKVLTKSSSVWDLKLL